MTAADGSKASFFVDAVGPGPLKYQWQVSKNGGSTWSNCTAAGADQPTYSFKTQLSYDGRKYRCRVTDANGQVTTQAVTLTVKTAGPTITTQPTNQSVATGKTVSFSVVASGTGTLQYQWQVSKDGGSTWSNCTATGYDQPAYSFKTQASYSGRKYRCKVTDSNGTTITNVVTLTVN